jgi:hypothetical protein
MGRKFGFALQGARKAYTNCGALPLHQSMGKEKKMPNYNGQVWQPRSLRGSRGDTCAYIWIDSPVGFLTLEARTVGNHFISFCFLACGVSTIATRLRRCYADLDTLAPWWRFCLFFEVVVALLSCPVFRPSVRIWRFTRLPTMEWPTIEWQHLSPHELMFSYPIWWMLVDSDQGFLSRTACHLLLFFIIKVVSLFLTIL